jgi:hypothetical protein
MTITTAGPASDNSQFVSEIIDTVKHNSSRIVANGKVLWVGMGDKSGIARLMQRLRTYFTPGMEVQVQTFKPFGDHGKWITQHETTIQ